MADLEEKIDKLTRLLQRQQNLGWIIWHGLVGAVVSTLGVILVLSVGIYLVNKLELIPGLNLFLDEIGPMLERIRRARGY